MTGRKKAAARTRWLPILLVIAISPGAFLTTVAQADDWTQIRNQAAIATSYNFTSLPTNAGQGMTIAVLTTGISARMQAQLGSRCRSENLVIAEPAADEHGIGTHTVSIVAALAPKASILSLKVLSKSGLSVFGIVARGIERAGALGANVIIVPLGASPTENDPYVTRAVIAALDKGVLIVAAAGNAGKRQTAYPANVNNVIAVGASDAQDNVPGYSNYGGKTIFAPGNSINAHWLGGKLRLLSGTSRSVTVAGAIYAVLWSQRPSASAKQIADAVIRTARIISVKGEEAKRIDGAAALTALLR